MRQGRDNSSVPNVSQDSFRTKLPTTHVQNVIQETTKIILGKANAIFARGVIFKSQREEFDATGVLKDTLWILKVPLLAKYALLAGHKYSLGKACAFLFKDPVVELYHCSRYVAIVGLSSYASSTTAAGVEDIIIPYYGGRVLVVKLM